VLGSVRIPYALPFRQFSFPRQDPESRGSMGFYAGIPEISGNLTKPAESGLWALWVLEFSLSLRKPREGRKLPWKVEIPASLVGRRQRKFFLTKRQAENDAEDFQNLGRFWGRIENSRLERVGVATVDSVGAF